MKIESTNNEKDKSRTFVSYNDELFVRMQKNVIREGKTVSLIEWKKQRTGHILNAKKSAEFESIFNSIRSNYENKKAYETASQPFVVAPGVKRTAVVESVKAPILSKEQLSQVIELVKSSQKLAAVKLYKDFTGAGLYDSKVFIDSISEDLENKKTLESLNQKFGSYSNKLSFIKELKKHASTHNSPLYTIKEIKDRMGWGLRESKMFFDELVR